VVWVLETRPFFAGPMITGPQTTPPNQAHPVCAAVSTDPTAVSASDVAGDTPWTSLGPIFLGNLPISQTTPPQQPHAWRDCVERFSPPHRTYFCGSQANNGEYSPLLSSNCPRQTFRSSKATRRARFWARLRTKHILFWSRLRIKPTLFWWVPAAVVARAMITHDD